jgi:ABC-type transporter Mla subunit MlaD
MDDQLTAQLAAAAAQLATATQALESALGQLNAQHDVLNAKIDRIVAAIDEGGPAFRPLLAEAGGPELTALQARVAELERVNAGLQAQAARASRKTLPPLVTAILAKNEMGDTFDAAVLDRALAPLSVDQRIAVKAEMARAGLIE